MLAEGSDVVRNEVLRALDDPREITNTQLVRPK